MMSAFCERLCWTDYSALFMRVTERINWQVKEELLDLMQLPSLRPDRARTLYSNGLLTVDSVAECASVDSLVKMFVRADGFVTHRESNREDLQLKYEYLYSFSHKLVSEAKLLMTKRKYDPDCTTNGYLGPGGGGAGDLWQGAEHIILSDSSSSDDDSDSSSEDDKSQNPEDFKE